jgi:hypothetical protein
MPRYKHLASEATIIPMLHRIGALGLALSVVRVNQGENQDDRCQKLFHEITPTFH